MLGIWKRHRQRIMKHRLTFCSGKIGQMAESLRLLEEAQQAIEIHDARYIEADIARLKGEVLWQQQDAHASQALARLQQALGSPLPARTLELQGARGQEHLWQLQGKGSEARQLVGEISGWCTAGLETPDFQKARAFLEDLFTCSLPSNAS